MVTSRVALAALLVCAACHHAKPARTPPAQPVPAPAQTATEAPAPAPAAVSNNLNVSDALIRQCQIRAQATPTFAFDQSDLSNEDRNVLTQIADCVIKGPLKGHRLALTGRADPRGTEEYNLGLGDRRAHTVASYLERLGVASAQLDSKTRGALDASGHDEASYSQDRRVDIGVD